MRKAFYTILAASILASGCSSELPQGVYKLPVPQLSRMNQTDYGLEVSEGLEIHQTSLSKNQSLADLLKKFQLPKNTVKQLKNQSASLLDISRPGKGQSVTVIKDEDSVHYMVLHKDKSEYVVFDVRDTDCVQVVSEGCREVETRRQEVSFQINSSESINEAVRRVGLNPDLGPRLSEVFRWSVDFFKIDKGDVVKVIYDEHFVENEPMGISNVYAASILHDGKVYNAMNYNYKGTSDYYDFNGQNLRKFFLKAPLKFTRISSGFSSARYHPILHITRAHNGVDYAAPTGTPIMALGDGKIIECGYKSGNGNYIKVQHDKTYTTQYLHMSKFEKGMKVGSIVKQGDVIGFVGQSGLATGPHLCFRFWQNGVQVNPLTVKSPQANKVEGIAALRFAEDAHHYRQLLDALPFNTNKLPQADEVEENLPEIAAE